MAEAATSMLVAVTGKAHVSASHASSCASLRRIGVAVCATNLGQSAQSARAALVRSVGAYLPQHQGPWSV